MRRLRGRCTAKGLGQRALPLTSCPCPALPAPPLFTILQQTPLPVPGIQVAHRHPTFLWTPLRPPDAFIPPPSPGPSSPPLKPPQPRPASQIKQQRCSRSSRSPPSAPRPSTPRPARQARIQPAPCVFLISLSHGDRWRGRSGRRGFSARPVAREGRAGKDTHARARHTGRSTKGVQANDG